LHSTVGRGKFLIISFRCTGLDDSRIEKGEKKMDKNNFKKINKIKTKNKDKIKNPRKLLIAGIDGLV
jgi:hypothetical protein